MQTIWIELPALDLERAIGFYADVFGHERGEIIDDGTRRISILPGTPSVSLNQVPGFTPTTEGSLPYFHVDEPLSATVERVVAHGGFVVEPITQRGDNGQFVLVADSEGNGVTIHSAEA